jgi:hypothetical protein
MSEAQVSLEHVNTKERMVITDPLTRQTLALLAQLAPRSISGRELVSELQSVGLPTPTRLLKGELFPRLVRLYHSGALQPWLGPVLPEPSCAEHPESLPWLRLASGLNVRVTNHLHESVTLIENQVALLRLADGSRKRAGLVAAWAEQTRGSEQAGSELLELLERMGLVLPSLD